MEKYANVENDSNQFNWSNGIILSLTDSLPKGSDLETPQPGALLKPALALPYCTVHSHLDYRYRKHADVTHIKEMVYEKTMGFVLDKDCLQSAWSFSIRRKGKRGDDLKILKT